MLQVQTIVRKYVENEAREFVPEQLQQESQTSMAMSSKGLNFKKISAVSVDDDGNEVTLCAKDIILKPFVLSMDHVGDDHNLHMHHQEMNEDKRLRLQTFLSTPKFIKCLTDVSLQLSHAKGVPKEEKVKMLRSALHKINQELPASVYIPFVSNSIRNYAVLHIPLSECRVFQTKERAPFMIAVELYRPDELNLYAASAYPLQSHDGGYAHVSSQNDGGKSKLAAHSFMSGQSFNLGDKDDDDVGLYQDALAADPRHGDEENNPYLKD